MRLLLFQVYFSSVKKGHLKNQEKTEKMQRGEYKS